LSKHRFEDRAAAAQRASERCMFAVTDASAAGST
jgi:hypothetical protein